MITVAMMMMMMTTNQVASNSQELMSPLMGASAAHGTSEQCAGLCFISDSTGVTGGNRGT